MHHALIALVAFATVTALLVSPCHATACRFSQQVQTVYNNDCTNPLEPYCNNAQLCATCHPARLGSFYAMCDCPPNQYCFPTASNANYGKCVPFDRAGTGCNSNLDCPILVSTSSGSTAVGYWSCVSGFCRPCNQTTYGTAAITCAGGSPYPQSSRPGETRQCGADGYWIGGGAINVGGSTTSAAPTSAPATSPAPSSSSSSGSRHSTDSIILLVLPAAVAMTMTWWFDARRRIATA